MADEIVAEVVDAGTKTPDSNNVEKPVVPVVPVTAQANSGWEAEKRGFLADLKKERAARQASEAAVATHQAELAQERRRVQALAGVNPKSDADTEADEVRAKFGQLFPGLAKLSDAQIEKLLSVADRADSLEEATASQWDRHGRKMLSTVVDAFAKELGGELTDRQIAKLKKAYVAEAEENPEFLARHEQGDPTLVAEFVKDFAADFLEPARRKALANQLDRQPRVPSGRDRSIVGAGGKKIDVTKDADVMDLLVAGRRERGQQFGR